MINTIQSWFRRNAYGKFAVRLLVAVGAAIVSIAISFLPHDAILQAIWVIVSSMFMGVIVLRQRLNESDEKRHSRLVNSRFNYFINNDPEALNVVFSDNLRTRAIEWIEHETGQQVTQIENFDALDSLARNGDKPGQLLLRVGLQLGEWNAGTDNADSLEKLKGNLNQFVLQNESVLGKQQLPGIYFREIQLGEKLPTGIHIFHPSSLILFSIKFYKKDSDRHSLSLSAKSHLFEGSDGQEKWDEFKKTVLSLYPEFQPVNGGSGPQKLDIPFFVSSIRESSPDQEAIIEKLAQLKPFLPQPVLEPGSDHES